METGKATRGSEKTNRNSSRCSRVLSLFARRSSPPLAPPPPPLAPPLPPSQPERAPTIKGPRASAPEVALSPAIPHSLGQVTNGVKLSPGRPATYQAASGALAKPSASFRRPASLVQAGQPVNKSSPFIGLRVLDMQQQRPPPRGHPQSESDDGEEFIQ